MIQPDACDPDHLPILRRGLQPRLHIKDDFIYKVTRPSTAWSTTATCASKAALATISSTIPKRVTTPLIRKTPQKPGSAPRLLTCPSGARSAGTRRWIIVADRLVEIYQRDGPQAHGSLLLRQSHQRR